MPGENCAIFGCPTSRRHASISIFKVPLPNNEVNKKWGSELINIITKDRQVDALLRKRIESSKIFICERHFSPDQIWVYPTRKSLKEGALPHLNLPQKSVLLSSHQPQPATKIRSTTSIQKREERVSFLDISPPFSPSTVYSNFEDFKKRIVKLSLNNCWQIDIQDTLVIITSISVEHILPKYEIFVDQSLGFSVRVYGWLLPDDHELYSSFNRSFFNVTLTNFMFELSKHFFCEGITTPDPCKEINFQKHVIPKKFNYISFIPTKFFPAKCTSR